MRKYPHFLIRLLLTICMAGYISRNGMERNGIISRNFEGIKYGTEWQSRGVFVRHISSFTGLYTSCVPRISMNE